MMADFDDDGVAFCYCFHLAIPLWFGCLALRAMCDSNDRNSDRRNYNRES